MRRPGSMLRHRLDIQTRGVEPNSGRRREATRGGGHARRCDSARFRVRSQESGVGHGGGGARRRRRAAAGVKEDEAATMVLAAGIHSAEVPVVRPDALGATGRGLMEGGAQIMRVPGAGLRGGGSHPAGTGYSPK